MDRYVVSKGPLRIKDDADICPGSGYCACSVVRAGGYVNRSGRFYAGCFSIKENLIFKLILWRNDETDFISVGMAMHVSIGRWRSLDILYKMHSDMQRRILHNKGIHQHISFDKLLVGV